MRLLHTTELRFAEFFDSNIPPYAILSHKWGHDEVSYQEFQNIRTSYLRMCLRLLIGYDPIPSEIDELAYSQIVADTFGFSYLTGARFTIRFTLKVVFAMVVDLSIASILSRELRNHLGFILMIVVYYFSPENIDTVPWTIFVVALLLLGFAHYVETFWPKTYGAGYAKILNCCEYAAADKVHGPFDWIWIDTCCIDKTSSSELSEAINSMYRWYETSKVCYAYLSDIPGATSAGEKTVAEYLDAGRLQPEKSEALRASTWFTRGWTLQELLAPRKMIFLDDEWELLGGRTSVADDIARATGISQTYIKNTKLAKKASIATKFSWAAHRQTSRLEDMVYCLLGLLGVNMPFLYGEGASAFRRLQLELLRTKADESIFLWEPAAGSATYSLPLLPSHQEELPSVPKRLCSPIATDIRSLRVNEGSNYYGSNVRNEFYLARPPFSVTNQGLELTIPRHFARQPAFFLPLKHFLFDADGEVRAYAICLKKKGAVWVRSFNHESKEHIGPPGFTQVRRFREERAGLYAVPIEWLWGREDLERRGSEIIYVDISEPN